MSQTIFSREYSDEDLADLERDVSEAFYPDMNPKVVDLPTKDGFIKGHFTVTITWEEE